MAAPQLHAHSMHEKNTNKTEYVMPQTQKDGDISSPANNSLFVNFSFTKAFL